MSEVEKVEIDQLNARLKEFNTAFFGDAFKPENRIKGQLWEYKEAKFRYLDSLRTDLAVYLKPNGWNVKLVDKDEDIFCSATNGSLTISYSAMQNGRYERTYFVVVTGNNAVTGDKVEYQFIVDADSDFDDRLLQYFDPDRTNYAKAYKPKGTTGGKLKSIEQLKNIVSIAEKVVEHNNGLKGKYNFQAVAGAQFVKQNGIDLNEEAEIKFTNVSMLVGRIEEIYGIGMRKSTM